jgi:hypothetical protein
VPVPNPTALLTWAHKANEGVEDEAWRDEVLQLVVNLRHFGVDCDLDLFHLTEPGIDWSHWGPRRIQECDFTIAAVNRAWRERFEGTNSPTQGAGAAAEANVLHGLFAANQHDARRRLVIVVLPGASTADVPLQLSGYQRFVVKDFTLDGLIPLLRLLTDQPEHRAPEVGVVPDLSGLPPLADIPPLPASTWSAIDEAAGTPRRHDTVPGVPDAGQDVVRQQIAGNPNGAAVRDLLARFMSLTGSKVHGRQPRGSSGVDHANFTDYLRLTMKGSTAGYLYPGTGLINPKVPAPLLDKALSAAPAAHRVKSSNASQQVSISVVDADTVAQALELLSVTAG